MEQLVVFVLLGLGPGVLIASLALGLVVQYRGAGVINLATGAIAVFGAYVFYGLKTGGYWFFEQFDLGAPWGVVPAFAATIATCALIGVLLDTLIYRPLRGAPPLATLIASLGVMLTLQAILIIRFGTAGQSGPSVLPNGPSDVVSIFGVPVPIDRFALLGILLILTATLVAVYRYSRFGLATRAAAESQVSAVLVGLAPNRISMVNTIIATVLVGVMGVLVAPTSQLDPNTLTLAIVPALGAALLARFTSFWIAALAGLGMGILQSVVVYAQTLTWFPTVGDATLPGVPQLLFFLVIVIAVGWRGARLPSRGAIHERRLPPAPAATRIAAPALTVALICIVALMVFPFDFRQAMINTLIGFVVCLSLVVVIGFVGQVSLVQVALAGVSGFAVSKLAQHTGIGFPLAPMIAVAVAVLFGLAAALPALRVRGVTLAIVTLAGAVALEQFGFNNTTFGQDIAGAPVPAPHLFGLDLGSRGDFPGWDGKVPSPMYGFVCLIVALTLGVLVARLRRTTFGLQMLAVRSNEPASAAAGISVSQVKIAAFALSSCIAGIGGVLFAYNFGTISADRFGLFQALAFVAFAYMGGITTIYGAALGAFLVPESLSGHAMNKWLGLSNDYLLLIGGISLIYIVVLYPQGMAAWRPTWPAYLPSWPKTKLGASR